VKGFILSADLISLHLVALFCGEDCFPLACHDEAFANSIGIPPLNEASFYIFTTGCHKHRFFICLLVSL
jgi:hypothetical protein